jgi:dephospho-CoA kinase
MLKVGLTGGLASGKTFVGQTLASFGCFLVRADELGHEVLLPGGPAYDSVVAEFGPGILDEVGRIDRRKLASEVFGEPERLARLNALVHPPVIQREEELIRQYEALDPGGITVVEAAILIETGSYKRFSQVILVVCEREQQILRAMKRDGMSREEVVARLDRQMPLEEKRKFAHFVIDTSGDKEDTVRQASEVYEDLRRLK